MSGSSRIARTLYNRLYSDFIRVGLYVGKIYVCTYLNQKHPGCKISIGQELATWIKEVTSKWVANACVVLLLMEIKFLIITIQAAKQNSFYPGLY